MALTHYSCSNCGAWQEYFAIPPSCFVCSDVRNALPDDGWDFVGFDEMRRRESSGELRCDWREIDENVWMFTNTPQIGIGSSGFLIVREAGNIAFEAAGFYTKPALEQIATLGGINFLSTSHPHGLGALWQLEREFAPEFTAFHRDAVQFSKALNVNFVFDDELEIDDEASIYLVGGHYEGHCVLYYKPRKLLFCGDALKFDLDSAGHTVGLSCHKAFHKQIPLSRREVEHYKAVIGALDFTQACTPFEHSRDTTTADAVRLFDELLKSKQITTRPVPSSKFQVSS